MATPGVNIIGAGLCGSLLAILLARRGIAVTVYERRPDPRAIDDTGGRSINLALAARGLRALESARVAQELAPCALAMRGRMIHSESGGLDFQTYGRTPEECIYSVGRAALNRLLIEAAAGERLVTLNFEHTLTGLDRELRQLSIQTPHGSRVERAAGITIATDGAGSAVRSTLHRHGDLREREEWLDHDYKELTIPASAAPETALARDALHIWPRGGFMLIALPNPDGSFTATLFLPRAGPSGFASLHSCERVRDFFAREFPDAARLIPRLAQEFTTHPQGRMATVHCTPWCVSKAPDRAILLMGDAAHAIVPFHGQGMNAAFEDCMALCARLDAGDSLIAACLKFESGRGADAEAIAAMALENYVEMRDTVRDPVFVRMKALGVELERRFPDRFIPRYSMVMFHPEIPYTEARRRGAIQTEILTALESGAIDLSQADALIESRLPPILSRVKNVIA